MMEKRKTGWTSKDFVRNVTKTNEWTTKDVIQMPEEKFKEIIKDSPSATGMVKELEDANLQEFAIGYTLCDVNEQMRKREEMVKGLMGLKEMMESQVGKAEKMKRGISQKNLSYIE
jgi:hypothetical protein